MSIVSSQCTSMQFGQRKMWYRCKIWKFSMLLNTLITCCQHFHLCSINAPSAICWIIVAVCSSMNIYHCDCLDTIDIIKLDREKRTVPCPWFRLFRVVERICVPITGMNCISQRTYQMLCCVNITPCAWFWYSLFFWWFLKEIKPTVWYYRVIATESVLLR